MLMVRWRHSLNIYETVYKNERDGVITQETLFLVEEIRQALKLHVGTNKVEGIGKDLKKKGCAVLGRKHKIFRAEENTISLAKKFRGYHTLT